MLQSKIKLNERIINDITTARNSRRIPAAKLSQAIMRDDSYISSLELGRLRSISSVDLVSLYCFIYEIAELESVAMVEALVNSDVPTQSSISRKLQRPYAGNYEANMTVNEQSPNAYTRKGGTEFAEPELIGDMLEELTGVITEAYMENPKDALYMLKSFITNMQFDQEFTMGVVGVPFFVFRSLSPDARKEALDEVLDVFRKYAAIASTKGNSSRGAVDEL